MKFGVLVFPGSNCDHDAFYAIEAVARQPVSFLWHDSSDLEGSDAIIVPGGFAYGDYLRTGAIARFSPIMESVRSLLPLAALSSASATVFRFSAKPAFCPARLCEMRG
jgi:phosphoribosylformylglycinamidine (FGAM) synthase-like amidotransferase family enzyme